VWRQQVESEAILLQRIGNVLGNTLRLMHLRRNYPRPDARDRFVHDMRAHGCAVSPAFMTHRSLRNWDPHMIESTRSLVQSLVNDGNSLAAAIVRVLVIAVLILVLAQLNAALDDLLSLLTGKVTSIG
jgi:hypothetical protein